MLEEIFESEEVVILNVGVSSTRWLAGEPNIVGTAYGCPRLLGEHGGLWQLVEFVVRVVLARQREVEADERSYILRYEIDDFLRVGIVPHVDMNQPQWVLVVDGATILSLCRGDAHEKHQEWKNGNQ